MATFSPKGLKAGSIIHGPDGQGYIVTRTTDLYTPIMTDTFEPFGGAPEPKAGTRMPLWLAEALKSE